MSVLSTDNEKISVFNKLHLFIRRAFCWSILGFTYVWGFIWLAIWHKYKIRDLNKIRHEFRNINKNWHGPVLVCPNHLTYIDSMLLIWAFGSFFFYLLNFKTFVWNFPRLNHVKDSKLYKLACYIGKSIPIDRDASTTKIKQTMQEATYLLAIGDYIMIFPEGTRSTSGRVDTENVSYGVGQLLQAVPNAKVLCTYLRGSSQKAKSTFPKKGDTFYCQLKLITPQTELTGLRATRDLSRQIIQTLHEMEQNYFEHTTTGK